MSTAHPQKHFKRLAILLVASSVPFILVLIPLVLFGQKWSDDYKVALAAVKTSSIVKADVGEPIEDGMLVWSVGHGKGNRRTTSSDYSIPISGPKGSGRASVTTRYDGSGWRVEKASWKFNDSERPIFPVPSASP